MLRKAVSFQKEEILEVLQEEPYFNLFMIGDILNYGFEQEFQTIYINEKLDQIVLVFHDTMLLYATQDFDSKEVINLFEKHKCSQIMAKKEITDKLIDDLGKNYQRTLSTFYKLDKIINDLDDQCQIATVENVESILDGLCVTEELKLLYHNREAQRNMMTNRIENDEGLHIFIEKDGKIISHINSTATTDESCLIGGMFTLNQYRRKGYASKCLKTLCTRLYNDGILPCAFTNNEIVKKLLEKNEFKAIGTWSIVGKKNNYE